MATKVFISWSGDLSKRLGEALRNWLPGALQYVRPYFTPDDIEKGAKWDPEIARELEESDIGLICLTRDNPDAAWILFEAGALSKNLHRSRVCTILFNLESADLKGPLATFQATRFNREDIKRMVETINNAAGDSKLETPVLETVFGMWWPKLEQQVSEILSSQTEDNREALRSDRDILEEILTLARMSASRSSTSPGISQSLVGDLVLGLEETASYAFREGRGLPFLRISRRLDRALRELCLEAGDQVGYDHFRMVLRELRRDLEAESEEPEAANPDLGILP